jgi:hypothetical protein
MIHHISIAVNNPLHVATVLAEVMQGNYYPFHIHPDSYIVLNGDEHGTGIELYPRGSELLPGEVEVNFQLNQQNNLGYVPFHAAISIPLSQDQVMEIGQRESWLVRKCDRGPFSLIEFWLENKIMIEFLSAEMASQYLEFTKPQNLAAFFSAAVS